MFRLPDGLVKGSTLGEKIVTPIAFLLCLAALGGIVLRGLGKI